MLSGAETSLQLEIKTSTTGRNVRQKKAAENPAAFL
jgi:hypothetical protein